MKSTQNQVLTVLAATAMFAVVIFGLNTSLDKSEVVSCLKWEEQAQEYRGFFLTQNQADMCDRKGIHIDAPISKK